MTNQPRSRSTATLAKASMTVIALICLGILLWPDLITSWIAGSTQWAISHLGRGFLILSSLFLVLSVALAISPWGKLTLGNGEKEFSTFSWLSMLFAAGMGSGLVFWGVAEPLTHALNPPMASDSIQNQALAITYFHWGLHAWALYAIAALCIAFFTYRHQAAESPSGAIRMGLQGWLGKRPRSMLAQIADLLAIIAVVFGVAAALANGVTLLYTGLSSATDTELPLGLTYTLILAAISIAFLSSAFSGIQVGIRWLSMINIVIALLLMLVLFFLSNPTHIIQGLVQSSIDYLKALPDWSINPIRNNGELGWSQGWTITYLIWWIAWTPFVGVFIARISAGRTIRSFLAGVILVPTVFSIIWFAVLGGGAMEFNQNGLLSQALQSHYTQPLFTWFQNLPYGQLLTWTASLLLFVFLVTSADSAAYVLGMLSSGGNPNPANRLKLLWGVLTVLLAGGLLLRNNVDINKAVAIVGAIPFAVILILQLVALLRALAKEKH